MQKLALLILLFTSLNLYSQIDYDRTPKQYFMVELIPNENASLSGEEKKDIQRAHMKNIGLMVQNDQLVLAGPFPSGGGLFFLSVPTIEEAEELVKADPTVANKLNTYQIRPFVTERGLFTLEQLKN